LSACTTAIIDSFGYGRIPLQGIDPHDQDFIVIMPVNAPSISQRHKPEESDQKTHYGIDIIGLQSTPIISAADGKVILSKNSIWGNLVVVDHGLSENGMIIRTEYAHLSRRLVEAGEIVKRGQAIGRMGRTGLLSGGLVHLHFSVTKHKVGSTPGPDSDINPHLLWLNGPGRISCYQESQYIPENPLRLTYPVTCAIQ
jgi:murein DD-endopeptidase MepM/ murein hydrolase activator NlpD